jgi:hypothetical protein
MKIQFNDSTQVADKIIHIKSMHSYLKILLIIFFILTGTLNPKLNAQRLSRDLNVDLLVNQVGYPTLLPVCDIRLSISGTYGFNCPIFFPSTVWFKHMRISVTLPYG